MRCSMACRHNLVPALTCLNSSSWAGQNSVLVPAAAPQLSAPALGRGATCDRPLRPWLCRRRGRALPGRRPVNGIQQGGCMEFGMASATGAAPAIAAGCLQGGVPASTAMGRWLSLRGRLRCAGPQSALTSRGSLKPAMFASLSGGAEGRAWQWRVRKGMPVGRGHASAAYIRTKVWAGPDRFRQSCRDAEVAEQPPACQQRGGKRKVPNMLWCWLNSSSKPTPLQLVGAAQTCLQLQHCCWFAKRMTSG